MLHRMMVVAAALLLAAPAAAKPKPSPAQSAASQSALEAAKKDWQELKHDARRSKYRSHWLRIAGEFSTVAKKYPRTAEAPKALFDAAELYEDLSRISWIQDDVDAAAGLYEKLARSYPRDSLADDADLALARIYLSRKNDADQARSVLGAQLKRYPRGDMASQARAMLAQLPPEEPKSKVAAREEKPRKAEKPADSKPAPRPEPKQVASKEPKPEPRKPSADAKPQVKETDAEWASYQGTEKAPPVVDQAAIDGKIGADAIDMDDENDAPTAEDAKPVPPVAARAAAKDRIAALQTAVRSSDDLPLSAQMGLKVRRVVIDAGHGGHDTGASGPTGLKEKDVSLAVAKKLAKKLELQGLQVFLTRSEDKFVSLENRAAFANEKRADLFISVHCNASTSRKLRGVETYSLNVSSDRYAVRLAARENASSERSISDLQFMLTDLATRANTEDSRRLASLVQSSVVGGLRTRYGHVRDLGTKEALFYVLLGTHMPAILVEGSFISNPEEEKRLGDASFQDQLASSIAAGVERFVGDRAALATAGLP